MSQTTDRRELVNDRLIDSPGARRLGIRLALIERFGGAGNAVRLIQRAGRRQSVVRVTIATVQGAAIAGALVTVPLA